MPVKTYKPTTPSRRFAAGSTFDEITSRRPSGHCCACSARPAGNSAGHHYPPRMRALGANTV